MDYMLNVTITMLLFCIIFDPTDLLFKLKVPLFALTMIIWIGKYIITKKSIKINKNIIIYIFIFSLILPLVSMFNYSLINGNFIMYDGFNFFKSYVLLIIAIVFITEKIDIVKKISGIMSILSIVIFIILICSMISDKLFIALYEFGDKYTIFGMSSRVYGGIKFSSIYFHSSPIFCIPVAYYMKQALTTKDESKKKYIILIAINVWGMFISGTRNNIIMSLLIPILILFVYTKNKSTIIFITTIICSIFLLNNVEVIESMFSKDDISNEIKLDLVDEYYEEFKDFKSLILGQGIGSYFDCMWRGKVSVSELTYFEMFRTYGIIMGSIYLIMLLYPLSNLLKKDNKNNQYIYIAYLCYLMMCFVNPFLISSNGMIVLSVVLSMTFKCGKKEKYLIKGEL